MQLKTLCVAGVLLLVVSILILKHSYTHSDDVGAIVKNNGNAVEGSSSGLKDLRASSGSSQLRVSKLCATAKQLYNDGNENEAYDVLQQLKKEFAKLSIEELSEISDYNLLNEKNPSGKAIAGYALLEMASRDPHLALQSVNKHMLDDTFMQFDDIVRKADMVAPGCVAEWWRSLNSSQKTNAKFLVIATSSLSYNPYDAFEFIKNEAPANMTTSAESALIINWYRKSPDKALAYAQERNDQGALLRWIVADIAKEHPDKALEQLSLIKDQKFKLQAAEDLFASWGRSDLNDARKWLATNGSIDPKIKDVAAKNIAILSFNVDTVQSSWEYINQITDPAIKKQAEGQVWGKERDMVRNAVNKDPQQAITDLVSGKSQHDAYWIEEAMDVWMQKDFDKAEKWYGDNWKSLPAEKAQYAAASFAKLAIKQGDVDAASQWLPYIQDPKTKARIEADIDKALKN